MSGCSQAELGLMDLMSEMNNINTFETEEIVSLKINKLPETLTKGDAARVAIIQSMLSNITLKSKVRMDAKEQIFDGAFYLVEEASGKETPILSYVAAGGTVYVKVDDLAPFIKTLGNEEVSKKLAILDDVQYVSISEKEMSSLMSASGQATAFDLTDIKKQQQLYQKLMNTLTKEAYKGYETGMVQENANNKYTLKIDKERVLNNIEPFMVYTINNAETINTSIAKFLQGLDAEELAMLGFTPEIRTMVITEMDKAAKEVVNNRQMHLATVKSIADQAKQGSAIIGDKTGMTISIEKLADNNFKQTTEMTIQVMDPANPADNFDVSLYSAAEVKGIDSFTVTVPETGVISLTELQQRMPIVLTVDTEKEAYTISQGLGFNSGSVDVRLVDGRTYLPVRAIGEAMNETVGWDSAAKQAYIVKNGDTLNLEGKIFNNRAFIKIRDFEQLGYKVTWNAATKTVTLAK